MLRENRLSTTKNNELTNFLKELKKGYPAFNGANEVTINTHTTDKGDYPIHYAVIQNKKLVVEQILKSGMDVNVLGEDDCTPLDYAILHEHKDLTEYLKLKGGRANRL